MASHFSLSKFPKPPERPLGEGGGRKRRTNKLPGRWEFEKLTAFSPYDHCAMDLYSAVQLHNVHNLRRTNQEIPCIARRLLPGSCTAFFRTHPSYVTQKSLPLLPIAAVRRLPSRPPARRSCATRSRKALRYMARRWVGFVM